MRRQLNDARPRLAVDATDGRQLYLLRLVPTTGDSLSAKTRARAHFRRRVEVLLLVGGDGGGGGCRCSRTSHDLDHFTHHVHRSSGRPAFAVARVHYKANQSAHGEHHFIRAVSATRTYITSAAATTRIICCVLFYSIVSVAT